MRIGIDARVLCAPQIKGVGRYVQCLLDSLIGADGKHEYVLFYDGKAKVTERIPVHPRVKSVLLAAPSSEWWEQWTLPHALKREKIDVLHSVANTTAIWSPCPTVLTLHDAMSHRFAKQWGRRENFYWNNLQRLAYRGVRKFITPSSFAKKQLVDELNLPERKIEVVYHGISEIFRPADRERFEQWRRIYGIEQPYLFVAGARLPRKNIPTVLKAFEIVAKKIGKIQLVVSNVLGQTSIEELASTLASQNRIKLISHLDSADLVCAYTGAELFIFPSLEETFGFPLVEAMACGAPVVASNASCIPEVVGDAAYLVDCRRPEPLAEAMLKMLTDNALRTSFKTKGIEHAKKYRWETAAKKTLEVYEEVIRQ